MLGLLCLRKKGVGEGGARNGKYSKEVNTKRVIETGKRKNLRLREGG